MPGQRDMIISNLMAEEISELSFDELCTACSVSPDFILELVEFGLIEPRGKSQTSWRFQPIHVRRVRIVLHLQNDLDVNLSGAALAIDLIEEIEHLSVRLQTWEKYFSVKV